MIEPRQIATVRTMDELHEVLRRRADELKMSRATIDAISGLQSGYAAKLLAPVPIKMVGKVSLGPMLETLGLVIIVAEDAGALERIQRRSDAAARNESQVRLLTAGEHQLVVFKLSRRHMKKLARLATKGRKQIPPSKRRRIARRAALVRWRRKATAAPAASPCPKP
jgi:hypothetical protein